jgi:hypothetical protein
MNTTYTIEGANVVIAERNSLTDAMADAQDFADEARSQIVIRKQGTLVAIVRPSRKAWSK